MTTYGYLLPTRDQVLNSASPQELSSKTQSEVVGLARQAEEDGLDAVWIGDSVTAKPRHEPLTTLASVAAVTDDVSLGSAVYLPNLRHVVNVAHATATLDQLSGGRLHLGVGVGVGKDVAKEHENLGVSYETRGRRLNETLDVLGELWTGEPVTYDGPFHSLDGASIGFEPVQTPRIYVASSAYDPERGFPRTIRRRIREHGDAWMPTGIAPETYARGIEEFRNLVADAGRDPDETSAAVYADVVVADSEDEAVSEAQDYLQAYYGTETQMPADRVRKRGGFGPADSVREQLREYVHAGVDHVVVRFPSTRQREHLEAFASLAP